jgi:hypothetical protein
MMNCQTASITVTPAKAGVQSNKKFFSYWVPAVAGMTNKADSVIVIVFGLGKIF